MKNWCDENILTTFSGDLFVLFWRFASKHEEPHQNAAHSTSFFKKITQNYFLEKIFFECATFCDDAPCAEERNVKIKQVNHTKTFANTVCLHPVNEHHLIFSTKVIRTLSLANSLTVSLIVKYYFRQHWEKR